jgi:hypothetical protein
MTFRIGLLFQYVQEGNCRKGEASGKNGSVGCLLYAVARVGWQPKSSLSPVLSSQLIRSFFSGWRWRQRATWGRRPNGQTERCSVCTHRADVIGVARNLGNGICGNNPRSQSGMSRSRCSGRCISVSRWRSALG